MISEIIIRRVNNHELIDIIELLASKIWHEFYSPELGRESVQYMLNMFQSGEAIRNQLNNGMKYYLIQDNDNYLGYFGIEILEDSCFLSKLYIQAENRRRGLGRQAIQLIETLAKEHKISKIVLKVYRNNSGAIKAYRKYGFDIVEPVSQDIGNGVVLEDYIMQKELL